MKTFPLVAIAFLAAACGSPVGPTSQPFSRSGTGPVTLELPASTAYVRVEVRSEANQCHYFEVFNAQRLLIADILGDCGAAIGLRFEKTYEVLGQRLDIRGSAGFYTKPYAWTVEEVR